MRTSVIITTFKRPHLLKHTLKSIRKQIGDYEIIIINDGLEDGSHELADYFDARYFYLGDRNKNFELWRVPAYAINYGVKRSKGDALIISCAEIYHLDNCIENLTQAIENSKVMAITNGFDDTTGNYLQDLECRIEYPPLDQCVTLNTKLPFLMGVSRQAFFDIGGYDEDFSGQGYDDNDFVDRMLAYNYPYHTVNATCVHLFHPRNNNGHATRTQTRLMYNRTLYNQRKGTIIRNKKGWGNG